MVCRRLHRVISDLRMFYVFRRFDISHQFKWAMTSERADSPAAFGSTEALHVGLLLTFHSAMKERGSTVKMTTFIKSDGRSMERSLGCVELHVRVVSGGLSDVYDKLS